MGLYVLTEKIKQDKNRVNIQNISDNAGVGSHQLVRVEGLGPLEGGIRILPGPLLRD